MSEQDLRDKIAQYKATSSTMSEKEKAEAENRIWEVWVGLSGMPKFKSRRNWAAATFGGPCAQYEIRSQLLLAGSWTDPLWQMIEDGVTRGAVRNVFRQARVKVAKQIPHAEAVSQAIADYNKRGYTARTADGKLYRRMSPLEKQRSQPPPADISFEMDMDGTQNQRSKQFLSKLVALADEFLRTSVPGLSGIDDKSMKLARDEFVSFVQEAAKDLRRQVYTMRSQTKKDRERSSRVSRDVFRKAAEVLGISVVWNQDVDMRKAKKIMLTRCAQLHPDKHGGHMSDEQKAEYTAVVNAYKTLERYMEGRKSHEDGERSHEGQ